MQELTYTRCGDYFIPNIRLDTETRPIGRWGRMRRDYIKEYRPALYSQLCLNGRLWTYLADLNEQSQSCLELTIERMKATENMTEALSQYDQMLWAGMINNIRSRAEEIVITEMLCR